MYNDLWENLDELVALVMQNKAEKVIYLNWSKKVAFIGLKYNLPESTFIFVISGKSLYIKSLLQVESGQGLFQVSNNIVSVFYSDGKPY